MFELRGFFVVFICLFVCLGFFESSSLGPLFDVPGPCFAQDGVFADRCPTLYISGIPQTELSCFFPKLSFSLAALSLESGEKKGCCGIFVAYPSDDCCYDLTAICQTRKKTTTTTKKIPYS